MNTIKLMKNNASVDAVILTKKESIEGISKRFKVSLEKIGMIGDESNDIPLLTIPGLGFAGAPNNAQDRVKEEVRYLPNGYVSPFDVFEGFRDFYEKAKERGIKLVISDKDGVLKEGGDYRWGSEFRKIALNMGKQGNPLVAILTGSGLSQNTVFMEKYGLDNRLKKSPVVVKHPFLLMVESGAIHVNVLTGKQLNYVEEIHPVLLKVLKGKFENRVRERIDKEVLPLMNLGWSKDYDDQDERVYHVKDKQSMVTFNVPRKFKNGAPYRKSPEAEKYRNLVMKIMEETAQELNVKYEFV